MHRKTVQFLLIAAAGHFAQPVFGGAQLTPAGDVRVSPGQNSLLAVSLTSGGAEVAALQFDLDWDTALDLRVLPGEGVRVTGKLLFSAPLAGRGIRYLIAGTNQGVLPDGELLRFVIQCRTDAEAGQASMRMRNVIA